jgi:hypothetical protein
LAGVEQAVNAKVDGGEIADYYSGVVKEHLARILAVWLVLVFGLIESQGGGIGDEWYLVSREGKLLRKLDSKAGDLLDPEAGQTYRLEGNVLKTYRVEDDTMTWSAQWPVMQTTDAAFTESRVFLYRLRSRNRTVKRHECRAPSLRQLRRFRLRPIWDAAHRQ